MERMPLRITIDIFSGRENPALELTEKEAQEAIQRLLPVRELEKEERRLPPEPTLGYRGLIIEQTGEPVKGLPRVFRLAHGDMLGPDLAHKASDEAFEDFVCGSTRMRDLDIEKGFPELVRQEIERFRLARERWPWDEPVVWPVEKPCECAPLYEPAWWNVPERQPYNNCYNYATNYRTDTFAQPGRAAGAQYTALDCASVKAASINDELMDSPAADNKCPDEGHLVALVIWPGWDFHWYRMGRNECWSHKPGGTAVTNLDNGGATIADPRTANRGPYVDFCTFMVVMHGHIKIS